ncbi:lantibiotic dehydratase [Hymenobacter frigidus]|uniref:lantibiotic dehydratase n=1 Tax=Hymenobacter frigidus TaxID=1524095 RepID=UPI00166A69E4|nr:lantibiotic dehydratase [Hymenobacter frigidus]
MSDLSARSLLNPSALRVEAESYYLLRRPLLPVQTVWWLHETTRQMPQALLPALLTLFSDPLLQEAIYTASPALHAELLKALATGGGDSPKSTEKLVLTLYKYTLRMSTRCTPYGLFAGCARGEVGGHTEITFADQPLRKQSRLDMNYVSELVQSLMAAPALKEQLLYYPNNSLYRTGDTYRYVEFQVQNKRRTYTLTSVAYATYLEVLLTAAEPGCSFAHLLALVAQAEPTASAEEARAYVHQLIDSQLLVSELEPTITGNIYLEGLPERLKNKISAEELAPLHQLVQLLKAGGVANFQETHQLLSETYGQSASKDLIQTDLFYNTERNQLSAAVVATITEQVSELCRLGARVLLPDLVRFAKDFSERFEDQEIPLLLALDNESGVGYGSAGPGSGDYLPVLEGISPRGEAISANATWKKIVQLAHEVYHRALRDETTTVELTAADLAGLDEQPDLAAATPASLFAFGALLAESTQQLDAGKFQFSLGTFSGPSAANLLGRFCYGDEQLLEDVRESLRRTEPDTEDAVYAEVVHLPEARVGNILMRPTLRAYEIPFLSPATVPAENQLPVQDLLVSVRQGRVVLRSRRLNKQVIPRLSTAHNYMAGLPIYRFLCDLQKDNSYSGVNWSWGNLAEQAFLPRVQYKNIIVAKARWLIRRERLTGALGQPKVSLENLLRGYLASHQLPRWFCLAEHDNELLIDSEHPAALQLLLHQLEKTGQLKLTEFLATPDQCFVGGPNQRYANEVLLPLRNPGARPPKALALPVAQPLTRQFAPGSEWVYFKLYGGTKSMDQLLTEAILPLAEQWQARGIIRQWFFIRYTDPNFHLRIRFQLADNRPELLATVMQELPAALAAALAHGRLHKIQLDTYVRELERYGAANIEYAEALFSHDSLATARVLNLLGGDEGETFRWMLALRGLNEMLNDFGFELPQKQQLLDQMSRSFFQEFKGDKPLQVQLNEKYRKESRRLQSFLNPAEDVANGIEEATQEFADRRQNWSSVIVAIRAQYPEGLLATEAGYSLLFSYVHMYLNRFVLSRPRLHELTMYTLLCKCYTAQLAMRKSSSSPVKIPSYAS